MTWKRNSTVSNPSSKETPASIYIRDNYRPDDRVAAVVINKKTRATIQRIAPADSIAAEDGQRWLRYMNDNGYEVYLSTNALKDEAKSRTKDDIGNIRHIYLDIDENGNQALEKLLARSDLPQPNYVMTTSPGKYQVIWKVEGFDCEQAEELQRHLARDTGADVAVTDSARVLRLPGFYNCKYDPPHLVEVRETSKLTNTPESFSHLRKLEQPRGDANQNQPSAPKQKPAGRITQSERDWAYARRALSRGDDPDAIISAVASYRRFDKHSPRQYAERTVDKAAKSLKNKTHTKTQTIDLSR